MSNSNTIPIPSTQIYEQNENTAVNEQHNKYIEEMIMLNCKFDICRQLTHDKYNTISQSYTCDTSLLYELISEKHIEFENGRPSHFIVYSLIVAIGSSKNPIDIPSYVPIQEQEQEQTTNLSNSSNSSNMFSNSSNMFSNCNFYSDYFFKHPSIIKTINCNKNKCSDDENIDFLRNGIWCTKCNGQFINAYNLRKIMHQAINFMNIPRNSIVHMDKHCTKIDENNLECIKDVKKFLDNDFKKMKIIISSICNIDEKIKRTVNKLNIEKDYNQNILDIMLSIRGGTRENYCKMIIDFDTKLLTLSKLEKPV